MFALRSVLGRIPSASASASFSEPMAAAVVLALLTRFVRSSRRSASAVTTDDELTMKSWNVPWSRSSSLTTFVVVDSAGLK